MKASKRAKSRMRRQLGCYFNEMMKALLTCVILYVWMKSFYIVYYGNKVYSNTATVAPAKVDEVRQFHDEEKEKKILDLIVSNSLHLIHLYHVSKPPTIISKDEGFIESSSKSTPPATNTNGENNYNGIKAVFCELSWDIQKDNPSFVPMFRDLVLNSEHCQQNRVEIDFSKVMKEIRRYDQQQRAETMTIKPTGFIFHESRCGSTALVNSLAYSSPQFRVYSEPSPTLAALEICGYGSSTNNDNNSIGCSRDATVQLFQDLEARNY